MYAVMKRSFDWETMLTDIYDFVQKCPQCAKSRLQDRRHTSPMTLVPPTEPPTAVSIDILGPLINSQDGNRFILVMTDRFTKLTLTEPLRRIPTITVASAFLEIWIAAYGPPDYVLSDQGKKMDNPFFRAVMKMLGVKCKYTTPYHPQTNGQVERYNRTLLSQLRAFCEEQHRLWSRLLPVLGLAYNTCPHRATGVAPFDLLIPRGMPNLTVEGLTGSPTMGTADGTPLMAKRAIINGLKKVIPRCTRPWTDTRPAISAPGMPGYARRIRTSASVTSFTFAPSEGIISCPRRHWARSRFSTQMGLTSSSTKVTERAGSIATM